MQNVTEKNSENYWYLFLNKSQYWRWVFRRDPVEVDDGYIYIGKHSSRLLLENFADTVGNEFLKEQEYERLLISKLQDFIDAAIL